MNTRMLKDNLYAAMRRVWRDGWTIENGRFITRFIWSYVAIAKGLYADWRNKGRD